MNDQVLLITTNDIKYEFEIVHRRRANRYYKFFK